eukprot:sb/3466574/
MIGAVREEYGFDWPSNFSEERHSEYVIKHTRKQNKYVSRWKDLNGDYTRSPKLKKMVRKGIPRRYRFEVWMQISSAGANMKANPGLYDRLIVRCAEKTYKNIMNEADEKNLTCLKLDIPRTFPEHPGFREPVIRNNCQDILMAFCLYRPETGYCQGLNYLVGSLLLATQHPDGELRSEECFWLLVSLIDTIPDYHTTGMKGIERDCRVLEAYFNKKVPQTWQHFASFRLPIQLFAVKWFICLFVDVLPFHTVLHVWDTFFYEGNKILFRVAVYQMISHKEGIKSLDDECKLATYLKENFNWDPKAWDNYAYMKGVFQKTGKMSKERLEQMRQS